MAEVLEEIREAAEKRGYRVEEEKDTLIVAHPHVPVLRLRLALRGDRLEARLDTDGLRDYLDDLVEERGAEEARSIIEDALDDIGELVAHVEAVAKKHGVVLENRVRSDALDVLDELEDILET